MKIEYVMKAVNIMHGVDAQWQVADVASALEAEFLEGFDAGWERARDYNGTRGHTVPMVDTGPVERQQPSDHAYDELDY